MRKFLASFLVASLALVSCNSTEYVVKDQDKGQINPKTTSLLELCDAVQEKWEEDLTVSRIYVVAHRGNTMESFKQGIPDNSIPNILHAIEAGADMVELDVRTTKDGQLVLMHNETVNETTTGVGAVSSLTLEQIKSFDMVRNGKVYKDEQNNVAKVPTLLEALKATKDKIYVNLDLAGKNNVPAKVLEVIYEAGVEDQVMLFASGDIAEYQKLNPLVAVHPYIKSVEATSSYSGMIGAKLFQYGNTVYLNNSIPEFGTKMHVKGYLSYSNLLDRWDNALRNGDYTPLDKFIASGSDFVQTDVAELVIKYLDGKGLR